MTTVREFTPDEMASWDGPTLAMAQGWVKANGIKPNDISIGKPLAVELADGQQVIRYHRFVLNDAGQKQLDATGHDVLTAEATVPLRIPLPAAMHGRGDAASSTPGG